MYDIPISPCKGCTDRVIGCHGKCKEYIEWVEIKESIMCKIQAAKSDEFMKTEADIKGSKRRKRGFWR